MFKPVQTVLLSLFFANFSLTQTRFVRIQDFLPPVALITVTKYSCAENRIRTASDYHGRKAVAGSKSGLRRTARAQPQRWPGWVQLQAYCSSSRGSGKYDIVAFLMNGDIFIKSFWKQTFRADKLEVECPLHVHQVLGLWITNPRPLNHFGLGAHCWRRCSLNCGELLCLEPFLGNFVRSRSTKFLHRS